MAALSLLDLPDLALYNICSCISCPFDLLHFGNTCSRLRKISAAPTLWHALSFRWLRGLWVQMEEGSVEEQPRGWLLDIISQYSSKPIATKQECLFQDGEKWVRMDSRRFRFIFNLLVIAYAREKDDHPAVLYEQWLYDIGIYARLHPQTDYCTPILKICPDTINELTNLSQAAERDLRRRKQPFKNRESYISCVGTTTRVQMQYLYPCGPNGSICPLLMFPCGGGASQESSGMQGIATCLSTIFQRHLQLRFKAHSLPIRRVWEIIKVFCSVFVSELMLNIPLLRAQLGTVSLRAILLTFLVENAFDLKKLQLILAYFCIDMQCRDILMDLHMLVKRHEGIDFAIEEIRQQLRNHLMEEAEKVMFPPQASCNLVSRINLTDSDLIKGDNSQQEMSASAVITQHGALVTWHLIGRMRY